MKKKLFVTLIITLATLLCTFACVNAEENINVTLNDETVTFDTAPVMENDRILVPIRVIAEKMNFDVNWDQNTQTVTLENFNTILKLKINENSIKKDLKLANESYESKISTIALDTNATVINDRTYIPLRAVTESFGCEVDWKQDIKTVEIIYPNTYGKEVVFEDEGIEYLTKLELLLDGVIARRNEAIQMIYYNDLIKSKIKDCTVDELYPFKVYEGALPKIKSLGLIDNLNLCINSPTIDSLEDITKFPNIENLCLERQHFTDLTPLTFKKDWKTLKIAHNNISDYSPLLDINISECLRFGYGNSIYFSPVYFDIKDYKNLISILGEINDAHQKVIDEYISDDMTDKEKITAIHKWLNENIKYDYGYVSENQSIKNYSKIPGLVRGDRLSFNPTMLTHYGICENYALVFEKFCDMLDIPCICLSGSANAEDPDDTKSWVAHAWNVVKLEDGKFYHEDPTWSLKYNLLTSEELETYNNHKWYEESIKKAFIEKFGSSKEWRDHTNTTYGVDI